eukprot:CCRYP_004988-RA/>CCRYP_004988-RA protein AED:0.68 eAED:0.37 QI:0/-1/0/1/-1/1/1/0/432
MWIMQRSVRGLSFKHGQHLMNQAVGACAHLDLSPVIFRHSDYGGATNAAHVIAFSRSFDIWPSHFKRPPNVPRSIRHFWKLAASIPAKPCSILPTVSLDHTRPITSNGLLRVEGLLPVSSPCLEVVGPSVLSEGKLVRRLLTQEEFLSVYDVLSVLFDTLKSCGHWGVNHPLPFESAPSPVILTSLFRQLWSDGGVCVLETLESGLLSPEVSTVVSSDLVGEETDCSAEAVKDAVECNVPKPMQDPTISVPLGVLLYPNNDRLELDDDTEYSRSTLPLPIDRSDSDDTTATDITYRSCDTKSDDDSFMPRQKSQLKKPILSSDINKWEFLNDVSVVANITLETEDATESITSFGGESYSNSWSVALDTGDSDDQSTTSIASAETLFTFTSEASSQLFKPLPTSETLRSVEEATIGKKAVNADDSKVPKEILE